MNIYCLQTLAFQNSMCFLMSSRNGIMSVMFSFVHIWLSMFCSLNYHWWFSLYREMFFLQNSHRICPVYKLSNSSWVVPLSFISLKCVSLNPLIEAQRNKIEHKNWNNGIKISLSWWEINVCTEFFIKCISWIFGRCYIHSKSQVFTRYFQWEINHQIDTVMFPKHGRLYYVKYYVFPLVINIYNIESKIT